MANGDLQKNHKQIIVSDLKKKVISLARDLI